MNMPSLPDNINRLLILFSIIIMAYCFLTTRENEDKAGILIDDREELRDSINSKRTHLKLIKDDLIYESSVMAQKYKIENPIIDKDSVIVFDRITVGDTTEVLVSDTISKLYRNYKNNYGLLASQIDHW